MINSDILPVPQKRGLVRLYLSLDILLLLLMQNALL